MKSLTSLGVLALGLAVATSASAQENYRIGGGPTGGGWHPAVSAGAQMINRALDGKVNLAYSPSQGSVDNVRRVALGDFDTAWGHIVQVYQAWNGVGAFEEDGASKDFRVIANVRKQAQVIAVLAESPIKSFDDMVGKKVNLLSRGTGSNVNCRNIFTALGLIDKIEVRNLGFADSARALGDRQIDVYCSAGAPYTVPAISQLSIQRAVRYISMTEEEQAKVTSAFQFYAPITIPALEDVKGQDEPARSVSYDVWWIAYKDMSDDAIYEMVKAVADEENLKQLVNTAAYWKNLSGDFSALEPHGIQVHPAAAKYWRERGAEIPDSVVQGY